jgi:Lon protease-like protein
MTDKIAIPGRAIVIPVFPLPNVVFFPKMQLPLHVFEQRYRQMVRDALETERLIGMALLRGDWEKDYYQNPDIYSVGCLGSVAGVTPLPDGRFNILLHGVREYEIEEHVLTQTPYRRARVVLREEMAALEPGFFESVKKEVAGLARETVGERAPELIKALGDASLDGETWLNLYCASLDVSSLERQSLLEAKSLQDRAARLLQVLRFQAAENRTLADRFRRGPDSKLPH